MKPETLLVWERLIPVGKEETWLERVAWVGAENCVLSVFSTQKKARLQVFGQTEKCCRQLVAFHGGRLVKISAAAWFKASSKPIVLPFPPWLCVISDGKVPFRWRKLPRLLIPAGMAFGSGDHATTGMCLRQILKRSKGDARRFLDLGTGSGILALAAAMQGHEVVAIDFDPESIRTARDNQRMNPISGKIRWTRADVKTWEAAAKPFDLISANLFSDLLQEVLPKMKRWLKPGGEMVLSGVLKTQLGDVLRTIRKLDLKVLQVLKKGKWVCLVVFKKKPDRQL